MYWIHSIIAVFLFQSCIGLSIQRNRRQQASGSLYGSSNPSQGFNTNFYGTNLNNQNQNPNQGGKDLYGNPLIPGNTAPGLNNMGLPNQQQQQQQQQQHHQQLYGANNQQLMNPSYGVGGAYQPSGTNQVNPGLGLRDASGNPLPPGASGSSLYSASNPQLNYPGNTNQGLLNKDLYNPAANPNPNPNSQFGLNPNQQQQQQQQQYGLNNVNNNQYPYGSTYNGQQLPSNPSANNNNNNNNLWPNNNNQFNSNLWNQNRQVDANAANNNNNNNNNNLAYSNPNSPYFYNTNSARPFSATFSMFILSFFAIIFFHIY